MKRVFLLIAIFFILSLKAQHYIPIPLDTNHYWTYVGEVWQGNQGLLCQGSSKYKIRDTIIQSTAYKIFYKHTPQNLGMCENLEGDNHIIRQDTIAKKVYLRVNGNDKLLYNFNKNLGDTVMMYKLELLNPALNAYLTYTITSIDSVLLFDNKYHKRFCFNNQSQNRVIDGIGGETGLISPFYTIFESRLNMVCFGNKNSIIYSIFIGNNFSCMPDFTGISAIDKDLNYSIFPNPTTGELNLPNDVEYKFKLQNAIGIEITIQENFHNLKQNRTIDLKNISNGIYFLQISRNNKVIGTKRIIKQ